MGAGGRKLGSHVRSCENSWLFERCILQKTSKKSDIGLCHTVIRVEGGGDIPPTPHLSFPIPTFPIIGLLCQPTIVPAPKTPYYRAFMSTYDSPSP
jgi:hypothetical protein